MEDGAEHVAVLFDLDGTLLDTLDDLADSMNLVLRRMGFAVHPVEKYRYFVGDGMDTLAELVLPHDRRNSPDVQRCVAMMREVYGERWHDRSKPYDGITELLEELRRRGVATAILSNKPDDFTRKVVGHYFRDGLFSVILGAGPFPKKPDPSGAIHIAAQMGLKPGRFLYVGDTSTDMRTAVDAGMFALGALWGFRTADELSESGARALVSHPSEIPGYL